MVPCTNKATFLFCDDIWFTHLQNFNLDLTRPTKLRIGLEKIEIVTDASPFLYSGLPFYLYMAPPQRRLGLAN